MTHLRKGLLVKGESDVRTAALQEGGAGVTFGSVWRRNGPALPLAGTGLHEALLLTDRGAALPRRTFPATFAVDVARLGAAPNLQDGVGKV